MDNWINLLSIVFVGILGIYITTIDTRFALRQKLDPFRFIKFAYAFIGSSWASLYLSFLFVPDWQFHPNMRYIIRGLIILTLIALAMGSTARAQSVGLFKRKDLSI